MQKQINFLFKILIMGAFMPLLLKWFKKHFIPHEGNEHRPHFLRKENIKNVAILIVIVEAFVFLAPTDLIPDSFMNIIKHCIDDIGADSDCQR